MSFLNLEKWWGARLHTYLLQNLVRLFIGLITCSPNQTFPIVAKQDKTTMVYKSKFALLTMKLTRGLCIHNYKMSKIRFATHNEWRLSFVWFGNAISLRSLVPWCYIYPIFRDVYQHSCKSSEEHFASIFPGSPMK